MLDDLAQIVGSIEATSDERQRRSMIDALANRTDVDAARALIALYARVPWNDLRRDVLNALGKNGHERAVLRLVAVMRERSVAHTSAAATLALGATRSPLAGECLVGELTASEHLLRREVPAALGHIECFDAAAELTQLLTRRERLTPAVLEALVLALGRSGATSAWPALRDLLIERSARAANTAHGGREQRLDDALILAAGLLGDASAEPLLTTFPVRHDSFTHELRLASIERIHQRAALSMNDAMTAAITARDQASCWEAARRLRHYDDAALGPALVAREAAEPWRIATIASVMHSSLHFDAAWLKEHWDEIPLPIASAFVRARQRQNNGFIEQLSTMLPTVQITALLGCVAAPGLVSWLTSIAQREGNNAERIGAINALAAQGVMAEPGSSTWMEVSLSVRRLVHKSAGVVAVRDRALRALGQQGGNDPHALDLLGQVIEREPSSRGSAYAALASLGSVEAALVVSRRLDQLLPTEQAELERALATLALLNVPLHHAAALGRLLPHVPARARTALLRVLGCTRVEGSETLVRAALSDASQFVRLLGVFAARLNADGAIRSELLSIVKHEDASDTAAVLRSAATYCLASGGREQDQLALLDLLFAGDALLSTHGSVAPQRLLLLSALRHLTLAPGDTGEDLVALLDRTLQRSASTRLDGEVLACCVELRDTLVGRAREASVVQTPVVTLQAAVPLAVTTNTDAGLNTSISEYGRFSHEVKAALRNAELTFAHPELFDASVDKSTMVMEYVKSIDLLFQEHFGRELTRESPRLLGAMQSRVVQLGVDDERLDAVEMMRLLQCEGYFKPEEFPVHKLQLIVRGIVTGRIRYERHRTLDGLRAWAVLLLLFARSFTALGQSYKALLSMRSADADGVARAAASLVRLQDIRNDVAHRGTMLMMQDVAQARTRSLALLNELTQLLPL